MLKDSRKSGYPSMNNGGADGSGIGAGPAPGNGFTIGSGKRGRMCWKLFLNGIVPIMIGVDPFKLNPEGTTSSTWKLKNTGCPIKKANFPPLTLGAFEIHRVPNVRIKNFALFGHPVLGKARP